MSVITNNIVGWELGGSSVLRRDATLLQDAGRTATLATLTVMATVAASGKLVPLTDIAATDGSAFPSGIYIGDDIAAATLVAGDVTNQDIIISGDNKQINENLIILENSLTLDTVVTAIANGQKTIRQYLVDLGIFFTFPQTSTQRVAPLN